MDQPEPDVSSADADPPLSPLRPLAESAQRFVPLPTPRGVEVFVDDPHYLGLDIVDGPPRAAGWFAGELVEWAHYESIGWTAWCRFTLAAGVRTNGRFAAASVRPAPEDTEGVRDGVEGRPGEPDRPSTG